MCYKIGIICAADVELAPFLIHLENSVITVKAMMKFYEGTLCGVPVVAVECGVCRVNAAAAAQILIDKFAVGAIINAGTSGGMDISVKLFDTVVSTQSAYHDVDEHFLMTYHPRMSSAFFNSDKAMLEAAERVAQRNTEFNVRFGITMTGEKFIDDDNREEINIRYSPLAVDMETAGIAHVCYINNIPFIAVRTVTDTAEHSGVACFAVNCKLASEVTERFVNALITEITTKENL